MNNIKEQIRAEVERQKEYSRKMSVKANTNRMKYYFDGADEMCNQLLNFIDSQPGEQQEISLERFTEKMDDWKARFNRSDDIPVKGTMAFTARMFYMYPNVARLWYYSLPKATHSRN